MQSLANKLMSLFALIILAEGWGGRWILKSIYPTHELGWYPYIPVIFLFLGIGTIYVLAKNYKLESKKLVNLYMIVKLVKMFVAMIYILGFYFTFKTDLRIFGIVFAAFYATYIACEFYIFYSIEKQIKKEV